MGGCVTEDQNISHTQHLDLVYSQFCTLFDLLPDASGLSNDLTSSKPAEILPIDGIIGSAAQTSSNDSSASTKQKSTLAIAPSPPLNTPKNPGKTFEVYVIQSTTAGKASKGKKKDKGKVKSDTLKQDPPKPSIYDASRCKLKYPCLLCDEDHYIKHYPHCAKVSH